MVVSRGNKVKRRTRGEQLGRKDWLRAALALVGSSGVTGLRVQELASLLGSTTGSLYWHFSGRDDLLEALLEHWVEESTEAIATHIEEAEGAPEERLLVLMKMISDNPATASDMAMRQWAQSDARVARTVACMDARRTGVVKRLFEQMGFSEPDLTMRTQVILTYESCEPAIFPRASRAMRARLLAARHRMLCGR